MIPDPEAISQSARELVDRHGTAAVGAARENVDRAAAQGDMRARDLAILVLNEVERLVALSVRRPE